MMPTTVFGWLYVLYAVVFLGMVFVALRSIPPGPFRTKMAWVGSITAIAACLTSIAQGHFT